ncbi:hypothetical protein [Sphaerisporangium corydalis]|uniref:Uncharacterized protein n=1 Tax=Sphaerisporangium corydalis TaxID=1441875 RepID=A0ABV9EBH4_9ACTN|nr:hypothetical protein [Sphaerisporangium corydalis]
MIVRITAEWALWGKRPGTRDGDGVLSCSQGWLGPVDFGEIMTRYAPGTPAELPQVTVSWVGGGPDARLGLAVQEGSDGRDGLGRDIVLTRYFCAPFARLAAGPVSYGTLYESIAGCVLPVEGPLVLDVPPLDPAALAAAADETAVGAAALLLDGKRVCVVGGENVPLRDRLRFLDAVAALLPYGFRARLTASTWTSSATRHRIKLSFARHAPEGAHAVPWGRPVTIPADQETGHRYQRALTSLGGLAGLVARFARETEPRPMNADDRAAVLARFGGQDPDLDRRPDRDQDLYPEWDLDLDLDRGRHRDPDPGVDVDLGRDGDLGRDRDRDIDLDLEDGASEAAPGSLGALLASLPVHELAGAVLRQPDDLFARAVFSELTTRGEDPAERAEIGRTLGECGQLVAAIQRLHPGDPEAQRRRHQALLTAAYGPALDRRALEEVFFSPSLTPSAPLLAAMALMCAPDVRRLLVEAVFLDVLGRSGVARATVERIHALFAGQATGTAQDGSVAGRLFGLLDPDRGQNASNGPDRNGPAGGHPS